MKVNKLIIKSSYSRLQDGSMKSNYGDLLRSTVLLNCLNKDFLWFTDPRSVPLLKWFVEPRKLVSDAKYIASFELDQETKIYNIDNYVADRDFFSSLQGAWAGYLWNGGDDVSAENEFIKCIEPYTNFDCKASWQEALVRGMGFGWEKQDYALSSRRGDNIIFDIGLNWHVLPEWKSKRWTESKWIELEAKLSGEYSVSRQKGLYDFEEYIDWILSCRVIVTCDTLGYHLASALRKKVVVIAGVTENREYPYNRVVVVRPDSRECMPCNRPLCKYEVTCLDSLSVDKVAEMAVEMLEN